jgi:tetratricopeptide (TPR) repeat protein
MMRIKKRLTVLAVAAALSLGALGPASAEEAPRQETLDRLLAELREPGRDDYARIEDEIVWLWSQSGSPAMDLLLRRAETAMEAQDVDAAIEHLSALIDHAPEFAEAWFARATVFFTMGEYSLSMSDLEHALALNPDHFRALEQTAAILSELDRPDLAMGALEAASEINPNRESVRDGLESLERQLGASDL